MSDEQDKIINKIKKCLALSASSNEHEAATALRQAKKLMDAHQISDVDINAAEADERRTKASAKIKPANWEAVLARKVGDAFGCRVIFSGGGWPSSGEWCFIGCGSSPEVCGYVFAVLYRQAKRARDEHIKGNLKRCKVATKTRRADIFSEGWVSGVAGQLAAFAGTEQQTTAIDAYMAKRYPTLTTRKANDRNSGRSLRDHEYSDFAKGHLSGKDAQLNRGVGGSESAPQLSHSQK